jgi:hypothetical protein
VGVHGPGIYGQQQAGGAGQSGGGEGPAAGFVRS